MHSLDRMSKLEAAKKKKAIGQPDKEPTHKFVPKVLTLSRNFLNTMDYKAWQPTPTLANMHGALQQQEMNKCISARVKQVWNVPMHVLHRFLGFIINTTDQHLGQHDLHVLLLKSSIKYLLIPIPTLNAVIGSLCTPSSQESIFIVPSRLQF